MIFGWGRRAKRPEPIAALHATVVAAALEPGVYLDAGVADDFEGRFESLTLHTWLVARRLSALPPPAPDAAQELVDRIFSGLDHTLRELGISDIAVPRRMKELASGFLGRFEAYELALGQGGQPLRAALARNALGGRSPELLARYVEAAAARLDAADLATIVGDEPLFPFWSEI